MNKLVKLIENTKGKIFSVTFIKKDGSARKLTGRLGVLKHLKGGPAKYDSDRFIGVYDLQAGGYRLVNKETIKEVKFGGKVEK